MRQMQHHQFFGTSTVFLIMYLYISCQELTLLVQEEAICARVSGGRSRGERMIPFGINML